MDLAASQSTIKKIQQPNHLSEAGANRRSSVARRRSSVVAREHIDSMLKQMDTPSV